MNQLEATLAYVFLFLAECYGNTVLNSWTYRPLWSGLLLKGKSSLRHKQILFGYLIALKCSKEPKSCWALLWIRCFSTVIPSSCYKAIFVSPSLPAGCSQSSGWYCFDRKLEVWAMCIWKEDPVDLDTIHPLLVLYAALPPTLLHHDPDCSSKTVGSLQVCYGARSCCHQ